MSDRRAALARQSALNGIDYIEVLDDAETRLRVHFLVPRPDANALRQAIVAATITGGDSIPSVATAPLAASSWLTVGGLPALDIAVAAPGDFSTYTLGLVTNQAILDPYFARVGFSFKARCPSTLDCEVPLAQGAPAADHLPPIDYLAKDFPSFRRALSEFSALRYPAWQERSEADFGVMFMEALASVADDLSYLQDRIAAEAWLETATQRRSLVRLARLVDYESRPATAARTWLRVEVIDSWRGTIPTGLAVSAQAPDGSAIEFETGTGLDDRGPHPAASEWNRMRPYWWDDSERILARGATAMWIEDPGLPVALGQRVVIDTRPDLAGDRPLRQIVRLTEEPARAADPLFGKQLLRLGWSPADALEAERDLTRTEVGGNLVPATHGRRRTERFATTAGAAPGGVARAFIRTGANQTRQYLYTLAHAPLAWLDQDEPGELPRPELRVTELGSVARVWPWRRRLLDGSPPREVVTVEPIGYRALPGVDGAADIDGTGDTIRFGDGVFGAIPADGAVFEVTYRSGGGTRGNVAAGAIDRIDPAHPFASTITAIGNPLPAEGGADEEPADRVRELAPQAFRAQQFRAVRAEDYQRAATSLPWVQRAGTSFRYTGSWLSVFTAVDPRGSDHVAVDQLLELTRMLDRRRLAGYQAFALAPRYASLDLEVAVCARPDAFRGDVERGVLLALATSGFFHPDRFTFGVALERSALEAAIQDVPGVDGVVHVRYRRRGHTFDFVDMPDAVPVGQDEIVRVDNDPSRPERGSLRVGVLGGK
jgi:hypothetical protein